MRYLIYSIIKRMSEQSVKAAKNEVFCIDYILIALEVKLQLDYLGRENEELKLENERLKEKMGELESWIMMLLNNFY
jgi:regulator of replication initiation timing